MACSQFAMKNTRSTPTLIWFRGKGKGKSKREDKDLGCVFDFVRKGLVTTLTHVILY
jgi:hypothetical protein